MSCTSRVIGIIRLAAFVFPDGLKIERRAKSKLRTSIRNTSSGRVAYRSQQVLHLHSRPIYLPTPWFDFLAMMLVGMAFLKLGILTATKSVRFYVWMALLFFAVGLPAHAWLVWWFWKQHFSIESSKAFMIFLL